MVPPHFVGCVRLIRRCRRLRNQSVVKTKSVVAKSRINKSGLRKSEKVVNWQIKNEGKDARTIQHPVKLLKGEQGVDMILYSHVPVTPRSTGSI